MPTPSLIITPNSYQEGSLLGYRPSLADPNKVIPVEINCVRAGDVAMRRNKAGVWVTCPANTPRLHWNVGGTQASWLAEPQATNLLLQSGDLDSWTKAGGATVNNNVINSPIEGVMYDRLNVSNSAWVFRGSLTLLSNTTYTLSCFVKNDTLIASENIRIVLTNNQVAPNNFILTINFNIVAGTATYSIGGTAGTGFSGVATGKVTQETDGSYRIEVTGTTGSGTMGSIASVEFYSPQGAKSYFATVPQLETGSVATSPIITAGSTVTRNADVISRTGIADLIGQTEGTIYIDFIFRNTGSSGGIRVFASLEGDIANQFSGFTIATSNNGNDIGIGPIVYNLTEGRHKAAIVYNQTANQLKLFVDGQQRSSTGAFAGFLSTISRISMLSRINPFSSFNTDRYQNGECNVLSIFQTALTDVECITLTTL